VITYEQPLSIATDARPMFDIEIESHGGIVVRWRGAELAMLVDPIGAWIVFAGRVIAKVRVAVA
jgi:hypothetical protein